MVIMVRIGESGTGHGGVHRIVLYCRTHGSPRADLDYIPTLQIREGGRAEGSRTFSNIVQSRSLTQSQSTYLTFGVFIFNFELLYSSNWRGGCLAVEELQGGGGGFFVAVIFTCLCLEGGPSHAPTTLRCQQLFQSLQLEKSLFRTVRNTRTSQPLLSMHSPSPHPEYER